MASTKTMKAMTNKIMTRKFALIIVSSLGLAGCAQGLDGLVSSHESDRFLLTGSVSETTPTTALASLPREAGRVLSVREQRREDGLQQHIVISGDALASGENWIKIDVAARRPSGSARHHQIVSEMQAVFNGHTLPIYNYVMRNDHGPVGLAFGPVPDMGNCAYIWQEADQEDVQATDRLPFARTSGVWSVRVRLCRERLTQAHGVAFAQGLSLGAFSDPLYAPLATASTLAPTIAPSSLASLDAAPSAPRIERARGRLAPPSPSARVTVTAQSDTAPESPNSAVPIALPGSPRRTEPAPEPSGSVHAAAIAVPLPR